MPTFDERCGWEICPICFWEDDGQDTDDADVVRGGPNHDYSLKEARENFEKYNTMYRPSDKDAFEHEIKTKVLRMELYHAFFKAVNSGSEKKWEHSLNI